MATKAAHSRAYCSELSQPNKASILADLISQAFKASISLVLKPGVKDQLDAPGQKLPPLITTSVLWDFIFVSTSILWTFSHVSNPFKAMVSTKQHHFYFIILTLTCYQNSSTYGAKRFEDKYLYQKLPSLELKTYFCLSFLYFCLRAGIVSVLYLNLYTSQSQQTKSF